MKLGYKVASIAACLVTFCAATYSNAASTLAVTSTTAVSSSAKAELTNAKQSLQGKAIDNITSQAKSVATNSKQDAQATLASHAAAAQGKATNTPKAVPNIALAPGLVMPTSSAATQNNATQPLKTYVIHQGSLSQTIIQLAHANGWKHVIWSVANDYNFTGNITIKAPTLVAALSQLLQPYPLQAQFYRGNHVLVIVPRSVA